MTGRSRFESWSLWVLVLSDDCGQEHLTKCAQPLRVFTDNSEFGLVSTKEELDQICPDLNQGLHCIDRYTRRCMTEQQRFHFNHLYNGTNMVIHEICREGPYQTEFLRHAPCMQEVRTDYEKCAISYQQKIQKIMEFRNNSDSTPLNGGEAKLRTVCCSFQDYLRCSQTTVLMKCGEESAKFTENFLDRVASSLIQGLNVSRLTKWRRSRHFDRRNATHTLNLPLNDRETNLTRVKVPSELLSRVVTSIFDTGPLEALISSSLAFHQMEEEGGHERIA
uniref:Uncharacterized protein n=1 Tax=Timema genevievae TaxID=629358 RepID=A0A7R9K404_TIMGE|nr:unnamed protein product [Timema genevievae]